MASKNIVEIIIKGINQTKSGLTTPIKDLNSLGGALSKLKGAAIGMAVAAGAAMTVLINKAIDTADQMAKMSLKTGQSVETLSALAYAGSLADVSIEQIGKSMGVLSRNMVDAIQKTGEAREAFEVLGINLKTTDGRLKSTDHVLGEIADKFQGMENGAAKTGLAMKVLGKQGMEMIPLLNQGSEGLQKMKEEAERFGLVISTRTAKQAEEFKDNQTRLAGAFQGVVNKITAFVLPSMIKYQEQILESIENGGAWAVGLKFIEETLKGVFRFAQYVATIVGMLFTQVANLAAGIGTIVVGFVEDGFRGAKTAAKVYLADTAKDWEEFQKKMQDITFDVQPKTKGEKEKPTIPGVPTPEDVQTADQRFKELQDSSKRYLSTVREDQKALMAEVKKLQEEATLSWETFALDISKSFKSGVGDTIKDVLKGTKSLGQAFEDLGHKMVEAVVNYIAERAAAFATERLLNAAAIAILGTTTAAQIAAAQAIAAAYSPAAAAVSLASFGANAAPAIAGITAAYGASKSLSIAGFETGADSLPGTGLFLGHEKERVVTRDSNEKLTDFLNREEEGGGTLVVELHLDGQRMGRQMMKMKRRGTLQVKV